jgi:hypothetical protein
VLRPLTAFTHRRCANMADLPLSRFGEYDGTLLGGHVRAVLL